MLKTKKPSVSQAGTGKTQKTAAVSAKKNVVRKKRSVTGSNGPLKKASQGKKSVARKKVSRKTVAAVSPSAASPKAGARKGRPVSVDVLQRKLADALTALKAEKRKRQELAKNAKQTAKTAVMERKGLKSRIAELKQTLTQLQNEKKSNEKLAARQQKMEIARNEAVGKFLERWEKEYQKKNAAPAGRRKRRKRGRRAAS